MNIGIWGWDTPNDEWVKVLVDSEGHLQVDTLSSALPAGAATEDKQDNIIVHLATIAGFDDYMTDNMGLQIRGRIGATIGPAAGSTNALLRLIEADTGSIEAALGQCYGWVGDVWYHLLVESAADPNLRVKLYDGANGIDSDAIPAYPTISGRGILTLAQLFAKSGVSVYAIDAGNLAADNVATSGIGLNVRCFLHGFDGSKWDRLRTYGAGILKVGRAPIGATITRMTGLGQVGTAAAHDVYWISCSPDAPGAEWELSDATEAAQPIVYDHFDPDKHSEHLHFDPPYPFSNGIWVEKFDHMKSLVVCYI